MLSNSFVEYSDSPCRVGSINKKLLTPCRRVGLSRKRKSLALGELNERTIEPRKAEHEHIDLVNSQKVGDKKIKTDIRNSNKANKIKSKKIKDDIADPPETADKYEDLHVNENAKITGNVDHKAEKVARDNTPPGESLKLQKNRESSGRKKGKNKTSTSKKVHEDNVELSQDPVLKLKNQCKSPYRNEHPSEIDEDNFCIKKTYTNSRKHLKKINVIDSDEDSFSSTNSTETCKNVIIPKKTKIPERSSNRCREIKGTLSKINKASEKKKVVRELSLKDIQICPDSETNPEMPEPVVLLSRGIEHDHLTYCKKLEKTENNENDKPEKERLQQKEKLLKNEGDTPEERKQKKEITDNLFGTIKEAEQANKSGKQFLKSTKLRRILSMKKSSSFEEIIDNEHSEKDFDNVVATDQKDSILSSENESKDIPVPIDISSSINQLVSVHDANDSVAKEELEEDKLLKQVFTLEEKIKEKRDKVAKLRQAQIYRKKHNIDQLRELHLMWKTGCISGLKDLLKNLNSHGPIDMPTLLRKFQIPPDMVTLTPQGELV